MSAVVSYAAVDDLVDQLAAHEDVTSASTNPEDVRVPGVWVNLLNGIDLDTLGGYTHKAQLHLVVANNGHTRSRDALAKLLNAVLTVVEPDGVMYPAGLVLPDSPAVLPGLVVPLDIPAEYEDQE